VAAMMENVKQCDFLSAAILHVVILSHCLRQQLFFLAPIVESGRVTAYNSSLARSNLHAP